MLRIDFHSHLIPGVDDGSRDMVETIHMARGLAELGVERVHLTPHQYRQGNDFDVMALRQLTDTVWHALARAEIGIEVVRGAEYFYGERLIDAIAGEEELITFPHAGERCILIELPLREPAVGVRRVGEALLRRGIRPVLAHPERNEPQAARLERVQGWREAGWWFQLNLLSLVGAYGSGARVRAEELLARGSYEVCGSDLHRPMQLAALREAHHVLGEFAPAPAGSGRTEVQPT